MSAARSHPTSRRAVRITDADQRRRASLRLRRTRLMRQFLQRARHRLGLRQRIFVEGVRYTERDLTPLHRALSPRGRGVKEYLVRFPTQGQMRIRCTRSRIYADLAPDPRIEIYAEAAARLRPGQRVLELGCGTGAGSAILAKAVGPSGGVISLGSDRESIRYARRRYAFDNLALELGGVESLVGELDGAFDAVVAPDADEHRNSLPELWRVVVPGGWMLLHSVLAEEPPLADLLDHIARIDRPESGMVVISRAPNDTQRPSLEQ